MATSTLPKFSRGLKLVRVGVYLMLLQGVFSVVVAVKAFGADADDAIEMVTWFKYLMLTNVAATGAMLLGAITSIGELARVKISVRGMAIAIVGFALATAALAWTYLVLRDFLALVMNPGENLEAIVAAAAKFENLGFVSVAKDIGYGLGLVMVLRAIQQSAQAADQLALRDEAGHMSRAMMVMLAADLFYQLSYGLGSTPSALPMIGIGASFAVAGYWIYCHVRVGRFLGNAAHFVNEPHELPIATALKVPEVAELRGKPRVSRPLPVDRPSEPIVIVPPVVAPPAPRAQTAPADEPVDSGDGPRFLR